MHEAQDENSTTCLLCGGGSRRGWSGSGFAECVRCGVFFRDPLPIMSDLLRLYNRAYESPDRHSAETGGTSWDLARWQLQRIEAEVGAISTQHQVVLDFGAGRGMMGMALRSRGARAICVDPFSASMLRDLGLDAYEQLSDIPDSVEFSGVICSEVVEHLLDPVGALSEVTSRCVHGGWLFATTPNREGLRARVYRSRWSEAQKDGHLFLHSPRSFEFLLQRAGLARVEPLAWPTAPHVGSDRAKAWLLHRLGLAGSVKMLARKE